MAREASATLGAAEETGTGSNLLRKGRAMDVRAPPCPPSSGANWILCRGSGGAGRAGGGPEKGAHGRRIGPGRGKGVFRRRTRRDF